MLAIKEVISHYDLLTKKAYTLKVSQKPFIVIQYY
jgi:hypothetical protein